MSQHPSRRLLLLPLPPRQRPGRPLLVRPGCRRRLGGRRAGCATGPRSDSAGARHRRRARRRSPPSSTCRRPAHGEASRVPQRSAGEASAGRGPSGGTAADHPLDSLTICQRWLASTWQRIRVSRRRQHSVHGFRPKSGSAAWRTPSRAARLAAFASFTAALRARRSSSLSPRLGRAWVDMARTGRPRPAPWARASAQVLVPAASAAASMGLAGGRRAAGGTGGPVGRGCACSGCMGRTVEST